MSGFLAGNENTPIQIQKNKAYYNNIITITLLIKLLNIINSS